jgi:porin
MQETLSGDWRGARSVLRDNGITPTASYLAGFQTNTGVYAPQEWDYDAQLSFSLDLNLHKILRSPGLTFYVSAFEGSGGYLSRNINSTFSTTTLYAPSFYLGEMYMQQSLGDGHLLFAAGRLATNAQFATSPVLGNYLNGSFNANVGNIHVSDPAFIGPPPGVKSCITSTPPLEVSAGVFNNDLPSAFGVNYGAHFTLQNGNKGALILVKSRTGAAGAA